MVVSLFVGSGCTSQNRVEGYDFSGFCESVVLYDQTFYCGGVSQVYLSGLTLSILNLFYGLKYLELLRI